MHELSGKIKDFLIDFKTGKATVSFTLNEKDNAVNMYQDLLNVEKLSIKVDKHREKRSLDANAYCFTLIDKLSEKLNIPKKEIYRNAIKEIGGVSEIVCVQNQAVEKFCFEWQKKGLGWQTDIFPSRIEGCSNVVVYYGSSTYDSKQMNALIQNIIEACKEQGIETRTPQEIERMISLWK